MSNNDPVQIIDIVAAFQFAKQEADRAEQLAANAGDRSERVYGREDALAARNAEYVANNIAKKWRARADELEKIIFDER